MIMISVSIGDVCTEVSTDQAISFDAIETLLSRASTSSLNAYALYSSMPEPIGDFDRDDE
jgi:hypothetical protein